MGRLTGFTGRDSSWRLSVLQGPSQAGRMPTLPHFLEGHEKAQWWGNWTRVSSQAE